jgi:hypothetical protein
MTAAAAARIWLPIEGQAASEIATVPSPMPYVISKHHSSYLHGCPCGYHGDASRYVEVPRVEFDKLAADRLGVLECVA